MSARSTIPRHRTRSSACWRTKPDISRADTCPGCASSLRTRRPPRSSPCCLAPVRSPGAWRPAVRPPATWARSAPAAMQAPQEMIRRSLLSYVRAQEESADRAGVKFLNATQQSAKGMYDTFKRFADDILIVSSRRRSVSADASDAARARRGARGPGQDQSVLGQDRPARAAAASRPDARQALRLPGAAGHGARRYPPSDTSLPARYARAISAYRFGTSAAR